MTLEELTCVLRPAGGGIHVVSTGLDELLSLQKQLYGCASAHEVHAAWTSSLLRLGEAKAAILGVPSDAGAGFTRGSNRAPGAIRKHLIPDTSHPIWHERILDMGDVLTVPQLLSEEMISSEQRRRTAQELYGAYSDKKSRVISPLGICRSALDYAYQENPNLVPLVIGGDHSVAWPAFAAAFTHWEQTRGRRIGLLHIDAHTDLLSERLGIKYCFATWAYHANEMLGRDGRLVQVGIRASGRTKAHWENTLGVHQIWADDANSDGVDALVEDISTRFHSLGVDALYVSNDIDGTDPIFAAATGTPEPNGLRPEFISKLTLGLGERFALIGADLVEVAPPLAGHEADEPKKTLDTASQYIGDLLNLALRQ